MLFSNLLFFGAGLAVSKAVAADHNGDQASNLGNGSCEEGLEGSKSGVKWGAARLGMDDGRHQKEADDDREKLTANPTNLLA